MLDMFETAGETSIGTVRSYTGWYLGRQPDYHSGMIRFDTTILSTGNTKVLDDIQPRSIGSLGRCCHQHRHSKSQFLVPLERRENLRTELSEH